MSEGKKTAREIIEGYDGPAVRIMEVCGTHTHEIFRLGIRKLLPKQVELISGPGCPVCVTPVSYIDEAVYLAREKSVTICTFGDLVRVPGSKKSLADARSEGGKIHIVYSPADAEKYAKEHPEEEVVFLSVGFETTTPAGCLSVKKAKEEGRDLIVVDAGDDAAKQTSDIEDLISKNISVLIVNPVDSDAVAPAVKDAIAKGIKVISLDRAVNGVDVDCSIASDNVEGARMATEYLVSLVGKDAKVVELEGTSGSSATIDRGTGFHKVADEQLNVVSSQTANFNRSEGMTVMENMLQSNSDIKGVFAHNDEMALGAVEAIGNKDIVVVGFDSTDDALAAIKKGKMAATVAQKPDLMGATAVETAIKIINGEAVEKSIPVEVELVTK